MMVEEIFSILFIGAIIAVMLFYGIPLLLFAIAALVRLLLWPVIAFYRLSWWGIFQTVKWQERKNERQATTDSLARYEDHEYEATSEGEVVRGEGDTHSQGDRGGRSHVRDL